MHFDLIINKTHCEVLVTMVNVDSNDSLNINKKVVSKATVNCNTCYTLYFCPSLAVNNDHKFHKTRASNKPCLACL